MLNGLKLVRDLNLLIVLSYTLLDVGMKMKVSSFISKLEKKLQRENKTNKYLPKIKFTGQSECFKDLNCSEGLSYVINNKLTQYGKKEILSNCKK